MRTTFLLLIGTGCVSSAREIGGAATPVVVNAGLHEVNEPDSQRELRKLSESMALQHFGQSVGEGVGVGLFNQANKLAGGDAVASAATSADTPVPVAGVMSQPTVGPTTGTSRPGGLQSGVPAAKSPGASVVLGIAGGGGGLNGFVRSSVQEAFLAATDPQFKAGEQAMAEAIGEGALRGMITVLNKESPAISEMIRKQVGPIIQQIIREQIAPALRDMIQQNLAPAALSVWRQGAVDTLKLTVRPDLQPDVMQNALNASVGASRGTRQAMAESGLLTSSGEFSPKYKLYGWIAVAVVGTLVGALLLLLITLNLIAIHVWRNRNRIPLTGKTDR